MKYAWLFILSACTTPIVPQPTPEPPKPTLQDLLATPASQWPLQGWVPEYDFVIRETLKISPITKMPCDGPTTFRAIAKAESSFKRETMYMEPAPLNKYSIGLLQLSLADQKNYRIDCLWKTEDDLKHPIRNLYCGVQMMSILERKNPTLNFYQYGGKYFSTLRRLQDWPGKKQSGYERFKKELGACEK